jgi:hypothetical protein
MGVPGGAVCGSGLAPQRVKTLGGSPGPPEGDRDRHGRAHNLFLAHATA